MSENGCIHLDNYKSEHGIQSYITIYSYFVASTTSEARRLKAKCCFCYVCKTNESRLHSCLTCIFFGCYRKNHIQEHSKLKKHYLAIELSFGHVLCLACGDYKHDRQLMRVAEESHLKATAVAPYRDWWPRPRDLLLLDTNPCRRMLLKNTTIGLRGLVNFGNSCYVNSIIQVLMHIPPLRDYFLAERHTCKLTETPDTCFVCEISRIFQEFYSGNKSPLILKHLLVLVWANIEHMACNQQQDAHEFLMILLNFLHEQSAPLNPPPPPPPPPPASPPSSSPPTLPLSDQDSGAAAAVAATNSSSSHSCSCIIDLIFTGKLQSDITCHVCNGVSTTIDPFWDISLELDNKCGAGGGGGAGGTDMTSSNDASSQSSSSSGGSSSSASAAVKADGVGGESGSMSLDECLEQFTRAEHLGSIHCKSCDADQQQTKQLTVQKLPVVVCFHLKRFEAICKTVFAKISKVITFPLELDMSPFMSHRRRNRTSAAPAPATPASDSNYFQQIIEDNRYSLFAVVNHHGQNVGGGHYTAFVRQQYDEWFLCDDSKVTRANIADILNSEGYLLFYHKQILEYE